MNKIIHLTDTHLRANGVDVLGMDPGARLSTVIRSINDNHVDALCCVLTGDIADAGETEAYEAARHQLERLKVPVLLTLGNHDNRGNFFKVFGAEARDEDGFAQNTFDAGDFSIIVVDTLDEIHPGQGIVCPARLRWLAGQLERNAPKPALIFMHHPPLPIGLRWFDNMLIANGAAVMMLIKQFPNVAHLGFGHVHVNTNGHWRGLSFSGSRGTCHKILADPVATQADYVDHGPAYDVLLAGNDVVCVHSVEPAGPNRLIARELATTDERGSFISLRELKTDRWM